MNKKEVKNKVKNINKIMKSEGYKLSKKEKKEITNYLNNDMISFIKDIKKNNIKNMMF